MGGLWPHKAPFRRAAHWDGVFPLFFGAKSEEEELEQFKEAIGYVATQRTDPAAIEIICTGFTFYDKQAQASETIGKRAMLGMNWWLESLTPSRFGLDFTDEWPVATMRERILQGPLRI